MRLTTWKRWGYGTQLTFFRKDGLSEKVLESAVKCGALFITKNNENLILKEEMIIIGVSYHEFLRA